MKKLKNISVLYRYLISYFSIILLLAAAIGLFLFNASIKELNNATKKETEKKLSLAATDLENQYDIMQDIAINIATTLYYKPNYRDRGKFYETEIIEDFAKYDGRSPIADDYFMFYKNDDWVYKRTAKNTFDVYAKSYLGIDDEKALYQKLNAVEDFKIFLPQDNSQDWILLAYNVPISRYSEDEENACLCFVTHISTLQDRITNVSGAIDGTIVLKYKDNDFAYISEGDDSEYKQEDNVLISVSPEGIFETLLYPKNTTYDGLTYFLRINLIVIIVFVALFLGLSAVIAYRNYRPIKELAARYDISNEDAQERKDELRSIDFMLRNIIEKQQVSQTRLRRQFAQLKKQQLLLILNGEYDQEQEDLGGLTEPTIAGDYFGVAVVRTDKTKADENEDIITLIENLSDEEIKYYCVELKQENCIAVILGLISDNLVNDAAELLREVFTAAEIECTIGVGPIYHDIQKMPASLLAALSLSGNGMNDDWQSEQENLGEKDAWYDERPIAKMILAVRGADFEQAKIQLDLFVEGIYSKKPSLVMQRSIFYDVLAKIIRLSYDMNLPLSDEQISSIMVLNDIDSYYTEALQIIKNLSRRIEEASRKHNVDMLSEILSYIDEHALEYDLSQGKVAKHFSITENHLYRIIKEGTGKTYRDYVTLLRMKGAQRLLVNENLSVSNTCQKVGYINISHFIKTFKKVTGLTPAKYKELMMQTERFK